MKQERKEKTLNRELFRNQKFSFFSGLNILVELMLKMDSRVSGNSPKRFTG